MCGTFTREDKVHVPPVESKIFRGAKPTEPSGQVAEGCSCNFNLQQPRPGGAPLLLKGVIDATNMMVSKSHTGFGLIAKPSARSTLHEGGAEFISRGAAWCAETALLCVPHSLLRKPNVKASIVVQRGCTPNFPRGVVAYRATFAGMGATRFLQSTLLLDPHKHYRSAHMGMERTMVIESLDLAMLLELQDATETGAACVVGALRPRVGHVNEPHAL